MAIKTDAKLREDVVQELSWDPRVTEKEIAVAVKDGVVTIAGAVPSYAQKYAAERAAVVGAVTIVSVALAVQRHV